MTPWCHLELQTWPAQWGKSSWLPWWNLTADSISKVVAVAAPSNGSVVSSSFKPRRRHARTLIPILHGTLSPLQNFINFMTNRRQASSSTRLPSCHRTQSASSSSSRSGSKLKSTSISPVAGSISKFLLNFSAAKFASYIFLINGIIWILFNCIVFPLVVFQLTYYIFRFANMQPFLRLKSESSQSGSSRCVKSNYPS